MVFCQLLWEDGGVFVCDGILCGFPVTYAVFPYVTAFAVGLAYIPFVDDYHFAIGLSVAYCLFVVMLVLPISDEVCSVRHAFGKNKHVFKTLEILTGGSANCASWLFGVNHSIEQVESYLFEVECLLEGGA